MASTQYFDKYLNNLPHLSMDLQRNVSLMRDLDIRAQRQMYLADAMANQIFETITKSTDNDDALKTPNMNQKMVRMRKYYNLAHSYSEHKIRIARESYDLVDKYIRQLDVNLDKFRLDIEKSFTDKSKPVSKDFLQHGVNRNRYNRSSQEIEELKQEDNIENKRQRLNSADDNETEVMVENGSKVKAEAEAAAAAEDGVTKIEMVVNPNEPTYCLCNQVSFGEMIACDNENCPIEWFHFACVSLTNKSPIGSKWFCPNCKQT